MSVYGFIVYRTAECADTNWLYDVGDCQEIESELKKSKKSKSILLLGNTLESNEVGGCGVKWHKRE